MSAATAMGGNADYHERLALIKAGGIGTNRTIFVGVDERYQKPEKAVHKVSRPKEVAGNTRYPLGILGAAILGVIAVCFGRYARFQAFSGLNLEGQADWIANGVMGLAVGLVLTQMFRLRSKEHQAAQSVGVLAGICTFHNLVHWFPQAFEVMFSAEWVLLLQMATEPNSILFRGTFFVFGA